MIKKRKSLLPSSSATNPKPKSAAATSAPPQNDEPQFSNWLTKDAPGNPFILDGYDCYDFVSSMLSTTKDPGIASSFVSIRSDDGEATRGTLPEDHIEVPCSLSYDYDGETVDGVLFKSTVMEEKWDIYFYDSCLYFCRSWTGSLMLVAEMSPIEKSLQVSRVWVSRSEDPALAVQQVDYLIKSHLYKQRVPHPLPSDLQHEPNAVAMYSFSQYGRICCFGSFESTLSESLLKNTSRSEPNA
jgi:hypothetical protein